MLEDKAYPLSILPNKNKIAHLHLPFDKGMIKEKTGVTTMSNPYYDLPSRIEGSFAEIDSNIMIDLRDTNEEYASLQGQLSDLKQKYRFIDKIMEGDGEIHLTAEEHAVLIQYFHLYRKMDDMERLHIYFRGQTDAAAYLKKIKVL